MKPAPPFHTFVKSQYGFDDTVAMLKGAIEGENLMVIKEINPQKMLRMVGVKTKGIKQIFFSHPRFMKQLRDANMHAKIEPPLKVAVVETPKGTIVKYIGGCGGEASRHVTGGVVCSGGGRWSWTCSAGWIKIEPQGCPKAKTSPRAGLESWGEAIIILPHPQIIKGKAIMRR
jgi:uncharacterized protein (DUF302 family)